MSFLAFCCAHIKSLSPHFPILGALFPVLRNLFNSHPFQFKIYLLRYHLHSIPQQKDPEKLFKDAHVYTFVIVWKSVVTF